MAFTDKKEIGTLKVEGNCHLNFDELKQINRVRLVRRYDGN